MRMEDTHFLMTVATYTSEIEQNKKSIADHELHLCFF
jgi:hypothetical protein